MLCEDSVSPDEPRNSNADESAGQPDRPAEEGGGPLDQDALDALLAGDPGGEGAADEPAVDPLLNQAELDAMVEAQHDRQPERVYEDWTSGERPEIEKEPIDDPETLEALLGPAYESRMEDAAKTEAPSEGTAKGGLFTQDEVDAMLDGRPEKRGVPFEESMEGERPEIEKEPIEDPRILAVLLGSEGAGAAGAGPSDDEALDQEALDELVARGVEQADVPPESASPPPSSTEAEAIETPAVEAPQGTTDPLDPAALDALIEESKALPKEPAEAEASVVYEAQGTTDPLDQAALDALIEESKAPRKEPAEAEASVVDEPQGTTDSLDRAALDAPIEGARKAPEEPAAAGEPAKEESGEASVPLDRAALDALLEGELKGLAEEDEDSVLAGGGSEETLVEPNMDERLDAAAGAEPAEVIGDQEEIDRLIADMDSGDTSTPAQTPDRILSEAPDEAAETSLGESVTKELVGSENVAAAGTADAAGEADVLSQDLLDQLILESKTEEEKKPPPAPEVPEEEVPVEEAAAVDAGPAEAGEPEASEAEPRKRRLPSKLFLGKPRVPAVLVKVIRDDPLRAASSLAAGLLFTLGTFAYLYTHQLRQVPGIEELAAGGASGLARTTAHALDLIDKGSYAEAVDALDAAIKRVPVSAERTDTQFLRLEARFRSLPEEPTPREADPIHEEIDRLVEMASAHPRAPEALHWKARLYEREGNPIAARGVYKKILASYGSAAGLDYVLVGMAQNLLASNLPEEAQGPLDRILQEYPGSPLAPMAKLLMGDAYAAAGQADRAQAVYLQSARSHPDSRVGADAFERLGKMALESGQYKDAIRELEARLETATTVEGNDGVYLLLAQAYRADGRLQDARVLLNELIEFFPESGVTPNAFIELTQILDELGMRKEAVRLATQTVQRYPDTPEVLRNEGELLAQAGDASAAGRALLAAHSAGADDPQLLLAAGRHFHRAGELARAEKAFYRLTTQFPATTQALEGSIEWSRVTYEMGQAGKAIDRLEDLALVTEGKPQRLPVLSALGELYQDLEMRASVAEVFGQIAASTTEPEMLARAAIALMGADAWDEGLAVAGRVDVARLRDETAYAFLTKEGEALLRIDSKRGLDKMEQAYESYPVERTAEGDQRLLEANLATNRAARARAIVSELQALAARNPIETPRLVKASTTWADFLFQRRDYRAAADAYALAMGSAGTGGEGGGKAPTAGQYWAAYQRANALLSLSDFEGSIALFDRVAKSGSLWAKEAQARARSARLELRLRGGPVAAATDAE